MPHMKNEAGMIFVDPAMVPSFTERGYVITESPKQSIADKPIGRTLKPLYPILMQKDGNECIADESQKETLLAAGWVFVKKIEQEVQPPATNPGIRNLHLAAKPSIALRRGAEKAMVNAEQAAVMTTEAGGGWSRVDAVAAEIDPLAVVGPVAVVDPATVADTKIPKKGNRFIGTGGE